MGILKRTTRTIIVRSNLYNIFSCEVPRHTFVVRTSTTNELVKRWLNGPEAKNMSILKAKQQIIK